MDLSTELQCWIDCYGTPLTLGLMVKTTDDCQYPDFKNGTFMITSICFDSEGVNIGINDDGKPDDFSTGYDGFRINELALAS